MIFIVLISLVKSDDSWGTCQSSTQGIEAEEESIQHQTTSMNKIHGLISRNFQVGLVPVYLSWFFYRVIRRPIQIRQPLTSIRSV